MMCTLYLFSFSKKNILFAQNHKTFLYLIIISNLEIIFHEHLYNSYHILHYMLYYLNK